MICKQDMGKNLLVSKIKARIMRFCRLLIQRLGIVRQPEICENILLWSPALGCTNKKIHDPFLFDFSLPDCISKNAFLNENFQYVNGLGFHSQHLVTITNATVKGHRAMITVGRNNSYLAENHGRVSNVYSNPIYRGEWPIVRKRKLEGDWYCLMSPSGSQYFQWIWGELPRLFSALPHLPKGTKFLVDSKMVGFQKESLKLLGISPEQCMPQDAFQESEVERLLFSTPLGHNEHTTCPSDVAQNLGKAFVSAAGGYSNNNNRRIYISRANAKRRILTNEDELITYIKKQGFEIVEPHRLSYTEQVRLFSSCSCILAVHGAGLTNILFAPKGCKVLEMHNPQVTRKSYWVMSCILEHDYDCFVGNEVADSLEAGEPDLSVNMPKFEEWLKHALADE